MQVSKTQRIDSGMSGQKFQKTAFKTISVVDFIKRVIRKRIIVKDLYQS